MASGLCRHLGSCWCDVTPVGQVGARGADHSHARVADRIAEARRGNDPGRDKPSSAVGTSVSNLSTQLGGLSCEMFYVDVRSHYTSVPNSDSSQFLRSPSQGGILADSLDEESHLDVRRLTGEVAKTSL